jgi:hypothetical protein
MEEGGYCVEATDGKVLGRVTGECEDAANYPVLPALQTASNGATEGLLPARAFREACKKVPKGVRYHPILTHLAVVLAPNEATLASTDLDQINAGTYRQVEGKYPPVDDVLPKGEPTARFSVNAKLLKELLDVAAAFAGDDIPRVTVEVWMPKKAVPGQKEPTAVGPVRVRAKSNGQEFVGCIMPLA